MTITQTIRKFKDGSLSRAELVKRLGDHRYPLPDRLTKGPTDKFEREAWLEAEADYSQDGTWDEVRRALNVGDLSPDLYREIVDAHGIQRSQSAKVRA